MLSVAIKSARLIILMLLLVVSAYGKAYAADVLLIMRDYGREARLSTPLTEYFQQLNDYVRKDLKIVEINGTRHTKYDLPFLMDEGDVIRAVSLDFSVVRRKILLPQLGGGVFETSGEQMLELLLNKLPDAFISENGLLIELADSRAGQNPMFGLLPSFVDDMASAADRKISNKSTRLKKIQVVAPKQEWQYRYSDDINLRMVPVISLEATGSSVKELNKSIGYSLRQVMGIARSRCQKVVDETLNLTPQPN